MKTIIKRAGGLLAAAVVIATLGQAATAQADDKKRIVFVSGIVGLPVLQPARIGAQTRGEELGYDVSWVGPTQFSEAEMVNQMEIALAEKVDAVITSPTNPSVFRPIYQKFQEAGIPIVNAILDAPDDEDLRIAYIGTDQEKYGINAAHHLAKKMDGKANIAVLMTTLDMGNQVQQLAAFSKTIEAEYPGMKIVTKEPDNSDPIQAAEKIGTIFLTYPEVDAVFCLEVACGPAAAQVMRETGKTGVTVLAIDDVEDTLGAIREGLIWGTMTQDFYRMGYESVGFIHDHLDGKDVPSVTDSGTVLVTAENIDTYKN
ncbi:sugar ABC transporter substrate-binding protein [Oricola sp.]|uniref:sugar ABC transporter substrate-binding protein n=1 Tax=Oricola sp. TaxID=1979950 RepID=UPI003BAA0261